MRTHIYTHWAIQYKLYRKHVRHFTFIIKLLLVNCKLPNCKVTRVIINRDWYGLTRGLGCIKLSFPSPLGWDRIKLLGKKGREREKGSELKNGRVGKEIQLVATLYCKHPCKRVERSSLQATSSLPPLYVTPSIVSKGFRKCFHLFRITTEKTLNVLCFIYKKINNWANCSFDNFYIMLKQMYLIGTCLFFV